MLIALRFSPTGDPLQKPNPKWASNIILIASNKVPIWNTHFRYQERHNLNFDILSPRGPSAESVVF